jgi:hypothetical protein
MYAVQLAASPIKTNGRISSSPLTRHAPPLSSPLVRPDQKCLVRSAISVPYFCTINLAGSWVRGLGRRLAGLRLVRLRVRIPPRAWIFSLVSVVCCAGRVLCVGPIPSPRESYRVCSSQSINKTIFIIKWQLSVISTANNIAETCRRVNNW